MFDMWTRTSTRPTSSTNSTWTRTSARPIHLTNSATTSSVATAISATSTASTTTDMMTSRPYDCDAGFNFYNPFGSGWSEEQKKWCCKHEGRGCPPKEHTTWIGRSQLPKQLGKRVLTQHAVARRVLVVASSVLGLLSLMLLWGGARSSPHNASAYREGYEMVPTGLLEGAAE